MPGSRRGGGILIAAQATLVTIVLAGAGLLVGSVWKLAHLPLGFDPSGVLTVQVIVPSGWMDDGARRTAFERDLRTRVRGLPGVTGVSTSSDLPMSTGGSIGVIPEGAMAPQFATVTAADAALLPLLKVPVVSGRQLAETDTAGAPLVAVVNRAFVRGHWPDGNALNRRVTVRDTHRVVGVVEDVVELTDGTSRLRRGLVPSAAPAVYVPIEQFRMGRITFLSARAGPDLSPSALAAVIHEVSPEVTIRETTSLADMTRQATIETRFYAAVLAVFGGVALLLAAVGVYGVVSQSVSERTREFGVRIALGATTGRLFRMVLFQTGVALSLGALVGISAATQVTSVLRAWLFGLQPNDALTFSAVVAILLSAGIVAAWLPARTAAAVDPIEALRAD